MYPVLERELKSRKMSKRNLAESLYMDHSGLARKIRGYSKLTVEEAIAIKKAIVSDLPIEELFKMEGD